MYVKVDAVPGAKKEKVVKLDSNKFRIEVKEPAQRNMANKRIQQILAKEFGVIVTHVSMLTGHRSSSKMYSIEEKGD